MDGRRTFFCPIGAGIVLLNERPSFGEQECDRVRKPKLATAMAIGVLLVMGPTESRAQEGTCALVALEASPALDAAWRRATEDLRATLAHELTEPECVPLRLWVEPSTAGAVVRAQSMDGRETTRPVRDPRALVPVVIGLLASAPVEHAASAPPETPSAGLERDDTPGFAPRERAENVAAPPVRVALGLSTGVRMGVPTDVAMWDSELRVDVLLQDWSILAFMRYAPLGFVSAIALDSDAYTEIGVGFGVGRELRWGRHTLDLSASPSVVFVTLETDNPVEREGELSQFRINAAARYGYGTGSWWRLTVTLDSEAAPSSIVKARYPVPTLPPAPAWTVGLRLGASTTLL